MTKELNSPWATRLHRRARKGDPLGWFRSPLMDLDEIERFVSWSVQPASAETVSARLSVDLHLPGLEHASTVLRSCEVEIQSDCLAAMRSPGDVDLARGQHADRIAAEHRGDRSTDRQVNVEARVGVVEAD